MNFNSILIGSEDPARLADYYTKLFGEPGRLIWNIESDDVQGDFERFKAAGATVIREPYAFEGAPDSLIATFADPDDNYFQLATPMGPPEG